MAVSSNGTVLKIGDGTTPTEVFTAIAEIKDIKGPSSSVGTEDVTHQGSAAAEFVPTVLDNGEVSFDINLDPTSTTHADLYDDMESKTKRNFQLIMTDSGATQYAFAAYITKFERDMKVKGSLGASITLKITGAITES